MQTDAGKWLFRQPSEDAPARIFLFPYSGTGASMYRAWPERIGEVEVCLVQLPARENRLREPHPVTYQNLAAAAAAALAPLVDRPTGFFGHCGGALSAFATALELERTHGKELTALFMSSQLAPDEEPFGRWLWLGRDELAVELNILAEAAGTRMDPDFLDVALDVLEEDLAAQRRYRLDAPEPLACAVHTVGWKQDVEIRPEQLGGWTRHVPPGRHHEHLLDGGHHAFLAAPQPLLDLMGRAMAQAGAAS
ncbi:thioesterase domain-containing protein [Streptomyces viridifaciens]|nr:thioesterase [Streptomyces viridifaciens]UKZ09407.1 thioesterase domain-containing protein [Streptomyces viridifaciens]